MNLMSSTLLVEDTGVPFDELQAEQIQRFARPGRRQAGSASRASRSAAASCRSSPTRTAGTSAVAPACRRRPGRLPRGQARAVRKSYTGEPDVIAQELSDDPAVRDADTLLLTVPNQLGVEYNARLLETIARHIAPAIGWQPSAADKTDAPQAHV